MPPANALVLYHDNCPDGFTAAWAVWKRLGEAAEYRAVNYGQAPPIEEARGRRVILVDFSYPRAALDALNGVASSVEVYDHHKTAQADLTGWGLPGMVVFDMERSGAGIAWDVFNPSDRPRLVSYVEDRDLWRWALPHSREISELVFSLERTFPQWTQLAEEMERDLGALVATGAALLRAKRIRVTTICANARWVTLGKLPQRIPVVNASWDFSEIGEALCEQFPDAPCGGYYFDRHDKRQWGFRSRNGFDVSALCKEYGGGGHAAAAGFVSEIGWLP